MQRHLRSFPTLLALPDQAHKSQRATSCKLNRASLVACGKVESGSELRTRKPRRVDVPEMKRLESHLCSKRKLDPSFLALGLKLAPPRRPTSGLQRDERVFQLPQLGKGPRSRRQHRQTSLDVARSIGPRDERRWDLLHHAEIVAVAEDFERVQLSKKSWRYERRSVCPSLSMMISSPTSCGARRVKAATKWGESLMASWRRGTKPSSSCVIEGWKREARTGGVQSMRRKRSMRRWR